MNRLEYKKIISIHNNIYNWSYYRTTEGYIVIDNKLLEIDTNNGKEEPVIAATGERDKAIYYIRAHINLALNNSIYKINKRILFNRNKIQEVLIYKPDIPIQFFKNIHENPWYIYKLIDNILHTFKVDYVDMYRFKDYTRKYLVYKMTIKLISKEECKLLVHFADIDNRTLKYHFIFELKKAEINEAKRKDIEEYHNNKLKRKDVY